MTKLLYDVLDISSVNISKAVLFAINNTLVCETAKEASKMAYEHKHDVIFIIIISGDRKTSLFQ